MGDATPAPDRPIRIANVSGFLGDRFAAMREMLDGPDPVDVITGDYLAELTMLILGKQQAQRPAGRLRRGRSCARSPRTWATASTAV